MSWLKKNCCDGIYDSSIDVRFTKLCDNECSFCIEDMHGIESLGKTEVRRLINSVLTAVLMDGKDTVLILGGEPFLRPKELLEFVQGIRPVVKKIYITTSVPKEFKVMSESVWAIMNLIDGLNVSLHHWSNEVNNMILKSKRPHDRLKALEDASMWFGDKIRVQANLVKGGIETRDDVIKLIEVCDKMEISEIKLNELQDVGADLYVSFDELFPEIKLGQPFSGGCVSDISKHFGYEPEKIITVKRACFVVQPNSPKGASVLDLVKFFARKFKKRKPVRSSVIYENGLRSSGWIKKDVLIHIEKAS